MIKQLLAGVAAMGTVSGVASAQTYISMAPPPAAFAPPSILAPSTVTTITPGAPIPAGDHREITVQKVVGGNGNTGIEKDLLAGSP